MNRTRIQKISTFILMIILATICIPAALAQDPDDYIVTEAIANNLVMITSEGGRGVIHDFVGTAVPSGVTIDSEGDYIVTEANTDKLVKITTEGVRTVIFNFAPNSGPLGVAIDSEGDYIVTEWEADNLVKITPSGVRSEIFSFDSATHPSGVAIDSEGDYIVTEEAANNLVKITPGGARTVIHDFVSAAYPYSVAIDSEDDYIVTEHNANKLVKITPGGARTEIYEFDGGTNPIGVAIDSEGDYIVTEASANKLVKITTEGVRTVIYEFDGGTFPWGVAVYPDLISPTVLITSPTSGSYVGNITEVEGTSEDLHSGIEKVEVKIDDGSWQLSTGTTSWFCSLDTTSVVAGSHTITARATDNNNNTGTTSINVIVDNVPPTLSITSPTSGSELTSSSVTAIWTGLDAGSGIDYYEVKLDGGSWINVLTSNNHNFSGISDGSHTVYVKAVDGVGNSKEASVNFIVSAGLIFGLDLTTIAILGAAFIIVIVVIVYLIFRGRKPPTPPPSTPTPPPT